MVMQSIFLIGLMAVGKSTVGRLLAQSLQVDFFDTDQVIEENAGADIPWIFDVEGEQGFREREEQVIKELTRRQGIVLATGGGVVLRECNRRRLAAGGVVVHLDSPVERLVQRTQHDKNRPLLRSGEMRETLTRLQAERTPLYEEIADYRFVTDRQGPKVLAQTIENRLREDGVI
jgi:shikimate kinase